MPQQVSVFAENRPGKIDRLTAVLEKNNINIRAITISDSGDYGIIKLLLDKPVEGCNALKEEGIAATLKSIVAVKVSDRPGGLHKASSVLARNDINVEDAYGFTIRESDLAVFVFQVKDAQKTEKILREEGFTVLNDNELYYL
ncbi:MAG TPA: ACT domain-containing protein [Spirochaetota bacterium]|nr:ACT domain-containing protein [Spirochaetota bacterium]HPI89526.1 ACT domain-containing protein [Spirochaetota bacterium]HPR47114.1 ACT domain-containing protein [Spirochaetota bacterium]